MHDFITAVTREKKRMLKKQMVRQNSFLQAVKHAKNKQLGLIAEIKLASPSEGVLGGEKDIETRARQYETGGALALSLVIEKKYFNGDAAYISRVKRVVSLPVLAKDFVFDAYQVFEAAKAGADAVLLIAKIVPEKTLQHLVAFCRTIHVEPVVEVQNTKELYRALTTDAECIAVNARDLTTLDVDMHTACNLGRTIPKDRLFLAFSGVKTKEDVRMYRNAGAHAVLVGTSLMKSENPGEKIQELLS